MIDVMMGMMEDVRHHSGGPMISLKIIIHDVYDFMFIFHYKLKRKRIKLFTISDIIRLGELWKRLDWM